MGHFEDAEVQEIGLGDPTCCLGMTVTVNPNPKNK